MDISNNPDKLVLKIFCQSGENILAEKSQSTTHRAMTLYVAQRYIEYVLTKWAVH